MLEIKKIIDEREKKGKKKTTANKYSNKGVAKVIVKFWKLNGFVGRLS